MNHLEAYRLWASGDKSPEIYHRWAALSTISSFVSRRIWLDQGRDRTYTNLYILFVGPAGNGKSTAMKTAMKMVKDFKKFCPFLPGSQTWQSCVKDLGDSKLHRRKFKHTDREVTYTHGSLFCDEFMALLQNDPKGWITFLTQIYGCDDFDHKVKVVAEGESRYDLVENPYLVFLGCMTPDITKDIVKEGIISTGFNRRCIFVVAGRSGKCIPMRTLTAEQMKARDVCMKWAEKLVQTSGPFVFGPNALEFYNEWYYANHIRLQNETQPFMASWLDCKDQIILKVAMLLELGDNLDRKMSVKSLTEAVDLVDATEANFHRIFSLSGRNPISDIANKIRTIVESVKEPINFKLLERQLRPEGTAKEVTEALMQLQNDGFIEIYDIPSQANTPPIRLLGTPSQLAELRAAEPSSDPPKTSQPGSSSPFGFEERP